jgi:hypothetical protein
MNSTSVSNIAILTLGVGALSTAVELAKNSNFIGAGIAAVVGIAALWLYEHLPTTPPTLPPQ